MTDSKKRREVAEATLGLFVLAAALVATAIRKPKGGVLWMQNRRKSRDQRNEP